MTRAYSSPQLGRSTAGHVPTKNSICHVVEKHVAKSCYVLHRRPITISTIPGYSHVVDDKSAVRFEEHFLNVRYPCSSMDIQHYTFVSFQEFYQPISRYTLDEIGLEDGEYVADGANGLRTQC
jgi:hypothetical protein